MYNILQAVFSFYCNISGATGLAWSASVVAYCLCVCVFAGGALSSAAFNLSSVPLCWVTEAHNERSVLRWGATAGTSGHAQYTVMRWSEESHADFPEARRANWYVIKAHSQHMLISSFMPSDTFLWEEMTVISTSCLLSCLGSSTQRQQGWLITETRQLRLQKLGFIPGGLLSSQHFQQVEFSPRKQRPQQWLLSENKAGGKLWILLVYYFTFSLCFFKSSLKKGWGSLKRFPHHSTSRITNVPVLFLSTV